MITNVNDIKQIINKTIDIDMSHNLIEISINYDDMIDIEVTHRILQDTKLKYQQVYEKYGFPCVNNINRYESIKVDWDNKCQLIIQTERISATDMKIIGWFYVIGLPKSIHSVNQLKIFFI